MTTTIISDTETNGLLREATELHCICLVRGRGEVESYHDDLSIPSDGSIAEGLEILAGAPRRCDILYLHPGQGGRLLAAIAIAGAGSLDAAGAQKPDRGAEIDRLIVDLLEEDAHHLGRAAFPDQSQEP